MLHRVFINRKLLDLETDLLRDDETVTEERKLCLRLENHGWNKIRRQN